MSEAKEEDPVDLDFPDEVAEKRVRVGKTVYTLRSMGGPELASWMKTVAQKVRHQKTGGVDAGTSNFKNYQATLISLCLYDLRNLPVEVETVARWPAITQTGLFAECQKMNGLDDEAKERSKKDLALTNGDGTA